MWANLKSVEMRELNCWMSIYTSYIIHTYRRGEITCLLYFSKKSEVGEQKRMYADVQKWSETGPNKGVL